jgi:stage II sporulation protein GA (sporulation sigma-E factor processing peptidase)
MVVYADLIFLVNFLIDGALLLTTAWMRKTKIRWWRIAASAAIGALYVVLMLFPPLSFLFTFAVKCLFSLIMIWTAFGFGSLQAYLGNLGAFYLANFAVAGGVIGIHYMLQSSDEFWNGIWVSRTGGVQFGLKIGSVFIAIAAALLLLHFKAVFRGAERRQSISGYMAEVTISIDSFESRCVGLVDTGNHLYDPLTRTPVMIVEAKLWEGVIPEAWMKSIKAKEVDRLVATVAEDGDFRWQDRLRLVPYRGINRGTTFMLAVKPDRVVITYNEQMVEASKVLIGMDGGKLCSDGSYQAIIHPALVQ